MSLPGGILSSTPLPSTFMAPRTALRFDAAHGASDQHMGGIALGDASRGITYQLWTATLIDGDVWLAAPNTPAAPYLTGIGASWVALAFVQAARPFIAYSTSLGTASFYWFDSTILAFRTTALAGYIPRIFATLDDSRLLEFNTSDVILAYVRGGELFARQQRDRFGTEYDLGAAPATLVQIGMHMKWRLQFAFANVQDAGLPPAEFAPAVAA